MPLRQIRLATGQYYHIFNRGVARMPIFHSVYDYRYLLRALEYYRFRGVTIKLSSFVHFKKNEQDRVLEEINSTDIPLVTLVAFVLMPNHFHLLVRQDVENGIESYLARAMNSYVRYVNTRIERVGPLFQGVYKSVHIESDEQLVHLSRYIHLNPLVAGLVDRSSFATYPWSSLPSYLGKTDTFVQPNIVIQQFSTSKQYYEFVMDQADYVKRQSELEHLMIDFDGIS